MSLASNDNSLRRHFNPLWVPVLGCMQVVGGLVGLFRVTTQVDLLSPTPLGVTTKSLLVVTLVLVGSLYLAAVVAGVLLFLRRPRGVYLSRIVQIAQVLQFRLLGLHYVFVTGFGATIGFDTAGNYQLMVFPESDFQIFLYEGGGGLIAINGLALFFLGFLLSRPSDVFRRIPEPEVAS